MHWMLGSFKRKMVSPCAYWIQARTLNELLSFTFNWYLLHPSNAISVTRIYSCIHFLHTTLCRFHHGMNFLISSCDTLFPFSKHLNDDLMLIVVMSLMVVW